MLAGFSILTGLVTLAAFYFVVSDELNTRRVKSSNFDKPVRIWRSIRYRAYLASLKIVAERIGANGFSPQYIVAIQYGAFVPAAELAKHFRVPVLHVEVTLMSSGDVPVCTGVELRFDKELVAHSQIIVVDNTITTGKTLKMTLDEIGKVDGVDLVSCVVHRPSLNTPNYGSPDHLLFVSKKRVSPLLR